MEGNSLDLSITISQDEIFCQKEGSSILVRVAKLLRLSIYAPVALLDICTCMFKVTFKYAINTKIKIMNWLILLFISSHFHATFSHCDSIPKPKVDFKEILCLFISRIPYSTVNSISNYIESYVINSMTIHAIIS